MNIETKLENGKLVSTLTTNIVGDISIIYNQKITMVLNDSSGNKLTSIIYVTDTLKHGDTHTLEYAYTESDFVDNKLVGTVECLIVNRDDESVVTWKGFEEVDISLTVEDHSDDPMWWVTNGVWFNTWTPIAKATCIGIFSPMVRDDNGVIQKLSDTEVVKLKSAILDGLMIKYMLSDSSIIYDTDVWESNRVYEISIDNPEIGRTIYPEQEFCVYIKMNSTDAKGKNITHIIFDLDKDTLPIKIGELNYSLVCDGINEIKVLKGGMSFHLLQVPMKHKSTYSHSSDYTTSVKEEESVLIREIGLECGTGTLDSNGYYGAKMSEQTFSQLTHLDMIGVFAFANFDVISVGDTLLWSGVRKSTNTGKCVSLNTGETKVLTYIYTCTFLACKALTDRESIVPTILKSTGYIGNNYDHAMYAYSDVQELIKSHSLWTKESSYRYAGCDLSSNTQDWEEVNFLESCEYTFYRASVSSKVLDTYLAKGTFVKSIRGSYKEAKMEYYKIPESTGGLEDMAELFMNSKVSSTFNNLNATRPFSYYVKDTTANRMFYGCNIHSLDVKNTIYTLVRNLEARVSGGGTCTIDEMYANATIDVSYEGTYFNPANFYANNKSTVTGEPHVFKNATIVGGSLNDVPDSWK